MAWTEERRPDFGAIKYQTGAIALTTADAVQDAIEDTDESLVWQLRDQVYSVSLDLTAGEDMVCDGLDRRA